MTWLWPIITGITLFDVWTLAHLGFWVVVGSTCWAFRVEKYVSFTVCIILALAWEGFEKIAEKQWPERWQDPESFINSAISDPITCVVGFLGIWWLLEHRRRSNEI